MRVDAFYLASKIGELLEESLVGNRSHADTFFLTRSKLNGDFNLIALADGLLESLRVEVK